MHGSETYFIEPQLSNHVLLRLLILISSLRWSHVYVVELLEFLPFVPVQFLERVIILSGASVLMIHAFYKMHVCKCVCVNTNHCADS